MEGDPGIIVHNFGVTLTLERQADLGLFLHSRPTGRAAVRWLDLCCGRGNALIEAAAELSDVEVVGVDLVDFFAAPPGPRNLTLQAAALARWAPEHRFDLITSVHGLHYIGDKLAALARIATWLADDGRFVANFDARSIRLQDGAPAGRRLTSALRASGFIYDARTRRIGCHGRIVVDLPYSYVGSDDQAGPNYTGQPAINSHYVYANIGAQ